MNVPVIFEEEEGMYMYIYVYDNLFATIFASNNAILAESANILADIFPTQHAMMFGMVCPAKFDNVLPNIPGISLTTLHIGSQHVIWEESGNMTKMHTIKLRNPLW